MVIGHRAPQRQSAKGQYERLSQLLLHVWWHIVMQLSFDSHLGVSARAGVCQWRLPLMGRGYC